MTKNEALEKAQVTIDNDKRRTILEKRLTRLENLIKNESANDPNSILLDAVADGVVSWEVLCRELMANVADDALWTTCSNLGLTEDDDMGDEEFESHKRVSRKPAKNEAAKKPVKKESMKRPAKRSLVSCFHK